MNKKLLIPVLSTAMGLSVIGGITGAIAWYQYNSKVSASFIGTSVADTGVLQIGHKVLEDHDNNPQTPKIEVMKWERDFSLLGESAKLIPVTFGEMGKTEELLFDDEHNPLDEDQDGHQDVKIHENVLPTKAYAYPEAGAGEGYAPIKDNLPSWIEAEKGKHYAQFDIYLRAYQVNAEKEEGFELVERDVYLSDVVLKSVEDNKVAEEALRVHLNVEGQENLLLAKNEYKDDEATDNVNEALALFGGLDLDKNGHNDKYHATLFNDELKDYGVYPNDYSVESLRGKAIHQEGEEISYGIKDQYQETKALAGNSSIINTRDNDGKMPEAAEKKILTSSKDGEVKITVTVWLEGWEILKNGEIKDPQTGDVTGTTQGREWNPYFSAGTDVQLGLQFDAGMFRGIDLN